MSMFYSIKPLDENFFHNKILIFPTVSYNNTPQLCIDLLLENIGTIIKIDINHKYVNSIIGCSNSNNQIGVTLSIEVFQLVKYPNIILIQRRSTLISQTYHIYHQFTNDLLNWIKKSSFKEIVLLSSLPSYKRNIELVQNKLNIAYSIQSSYQSIYYHNIKDRLYQLLNNEKGGEITSIFLKNAMKQQQDNIITFCYYINEGNNIEDAKLYYKEIIKYLNIKQIEEQIVTPNSWKFCYGNQISDKIYA